MHWALGRPGVGERPWRGPWVPARGPPQSVLVLGVDRSPITLTPCPWPASPGGSAGGVLWPGLRPGPACGLPARPVPPPFLCSPLESHQLPAFHPPPPPPHLPPLPRSPCPPAMVLRPVQAVWQAAGGLALRAPRTPRASTEPRGRGCAQPGTDQHRRGAALEKRLRRPGHPAAGHQRLPVGLLCVTLQTWRQWQQRTGRARGSPGLVCTRPGEKGSPERAVGCSGPRGRTHTGASDSSSFSRDAALHPYLRNTLPSWCFCSKTFRIPVV